MRSLPELTGFSDLTNRELEILELLADGLGNQQIARRLFLAEKTVRNYVSRIFAKLEVHDRATAAVRARDAGFGGQNDSSGVEERVHDGEAPAAPEFGRQRDRALVLVEEARAELR
jgi:DNA-binding CsgD family transcriptional regulator